MSKGKMGSFLKCIYHCIELSVHVDVCIYIYIIRIALSFYASIYLCIYAGISLAAVMLITRPIVFFFLTTTRE